MHSRIVSEESLALLDVIRSVALEKIRLIGGALVAVMLAAKAKLSNDNGKVNTRDCQIISNHTAKVWVLFLMIL